MISFFKCVESERQTRTLTAATRAGNCTAGQPQRTPWKTRRLEPLQYGVRLCRTAVFVIADGGLGGS